MRISPATGYARATTGFTRADRGANMEGTRTDNTLPDMDQTTNFNGYEYNRHGVCINPDIAYSFGKDNFSYFEIEVSETPKGWDYGYHWHFDCAGGGGPCKIDNPNPYPSRSKAIVACAQGIKNSLRFLRRRNPAMEAELDCIIIEESGNKEQPRQYTIFDLL